MAGAQRDLDNLIASEFDSIEDLRTGLRFWENAVIAQKQRLDELERRMSALEAGAVAPPPSS